MEMWKRVMASGGWEEKQAGWGNRELDKGVLAGGEALMGVGELVE